MFIYLFYPRLPRRLLFGHLYLLFGMQPVVLVPLSLHLLPIHHLAVGYRLRLVEHRLIASSLLGMPQLHLLYGILVQHVYAPTAYAVGQLIGSEGLALHIEVRYVKLKHRAQRMAHHLLLRAIARHLPTQQLVYDIYLALRKLTSSHPLN